MPGACLLKGTEWPREAGSPGSRTQAEHTSYLPRSCPSRDWYPSPISGIQPCIDRLNFLCFGPERQIYVSRYVPSERQIYMSRYVPSEVEWAEADVSSKQEERSLWPDKNSAVVGQLPSPPAPLDLLRPYVFVSGKKGCRSRCDALRPVQDLSVAPFRCDALHPVL